MKSFYKIICVAAIAASLSGCASIVSKSNWPITIHSEPSGASINIVNRKGMEVYSGRTPATLKLKSGSGFFAKESYTVNFKLDGFQDKKVNLECKLNGWYIGNILLGGVLGFLIIDPATGAMYKLENDFVETRMDRTDNATSMAPVGQQHALKVLSKDDLPAEWVKHLVKL